MPSNQHVRFRDVLEFAIGGGWGQETPTAKESVQVRVIRGTDIPGINALELSNVPVRYEAPSKVEKRLLKPGDIVFEISGGSSAKGQPTGRTVFIDAQVLSRLNGPAIPASFCRLVRIKRQLVSPKFAYYWLQEMYASGRAFAYENQSTGISNFQFERFLDAEQLALPSLATQENVVSVLEALDARRLLLRQTNATLESIAQALFKSWFIDFDPVRAKAEGREPEGMDAATAALFPAEFERSARELLPRGWQVAAIQDVVENVYDGPHATPPEATEGPVFLGIKNLTGTSIDLAEVRHISEDDWSRWTKRVTPQADDIVFSYEAALGLFALVPPGLRCCLGRRLALVRPTPVIGTPHFWFHQFIGAPFQQLLDKHTVHGATVNRIALKEFPSFTVLDPGEKLRAAFEAVAKPLWTRIHANRQQAMSLAELRDALLPRLVSGKLRLPEAQEQVEEALA